MWNNGQKNIWQDIKDTWNDQPQSEKINIQISQLVNEFKSKVSQFERDSIKKDINMISGFIKKVINRFKK